MNDGNHGAPLSTGAAKQIWLHLLKRGEWLTIGEIRHVITAPCSNLTTTVQDMQERGIIASRRPEGRQNEYAVTSTCRVARGVTVKEMLEATTWD